MSKRNAYEQVETGIYRYTHNDDTVSYHERPTINGTRTYRSLGVNFTRQPTLKGARDEYNRRRREIAEGRNPYAEAKPEEPLKEAPVVMGDVLARYTEDGCPDKHKKKRAGQTLDDEEKHCETLMVFWADILPEDAGPAACDRYHTWRGEQGFHKGRTGNRQVDRELNTLNNACRWGARCGLLKNNPIADRPRYQPSSEVKHCREFAPQDANELHDAFRPFFSHPNSVVLGFQGLIEAMTGLRGQEPLCWGEGIFGQLTPDGKNVQVWREKGQHHVNPYCNVNEGLKAVLDAHASWKSENYPVRPEFFPSHCGGTVSKGALAKALRRLLKKGVLKRKLIPHGTGRAFYVLVRRSHGVSDEKIAFELGHKSNGACIRTTYGGVPQSWRDGNGPKLTWLPTKVAVAWAELEKNGWKCPAPETKADANANNGEPKESEPDCKEDQGK
jgi:hypothetical protein